MRALFAELYRRARAHRSRFAPRAELADWFSSKHATLPPIVGFGLPMASAGEPLVATIGINPSSREFEGERPPLTRIDDVEAQWARQSSYFEETAESGPYADWFVPAATFVRATGLIAGAPSSRLAPLSPYTDGRAVHLDLSPLATKAFDMVLRGKKRVPRDLAFEMLTEGIREILVPLLQHLHERGRLAAVIVFGYVPASSTARSAGSATMKRALAGAFDLSNCVRIGTVQPVHTVAWGVPQSTSAFASLTDIPFGFVSKGPSAWRRGNVPPTTIQAVGCELRLLRARVQ